MDPRLYLIAAIVHTMCKGEGEVRPEFREQLLTLASDTNPHIAQNAMTALLRLKGDAELGVGSGRNGDRAILDACARNARRRTKELLLAGRTST